ncbi:membrane protein [Vibrio tubiashii]|nr:membrane protein [Vibrio tubiashii]
MPRFIQILQLIIAVVIGAFVGYDLILHGISIFDEKYVTISCALFVLLEITLFVIYKLIEDD